MVGANALFDHLRGRILRDGPLTVAQYMEESLGHPEFGYYTTRDPLGARGDFITAPEISQIFGELIGAWCATVWQDMGTPTPFHLVELGPGRGTLMADALRATKSVSGFRDAARVHLIEMSPVLREKQKITLANLPIGSTDPYWHRDLSQVPDGPTIIIANEFFDALPVRQFQHVLASWRERMVDLNEAKDSFVFKLHDQPAKAHLIPDALTHAPDGAWAEVSPAGLRIMHTLADRLTRHDGAALVIDYGHTETTPGDTLQAVQSHGYADVLTSPGEQDLTTHVDFEALGRIAVEAGARLHGPVTQADFLNALGLATRTRRLAANAKDDAQAAAVLSGAERLVDSAQMGSLFKVLGISAAGMASLPALPTLPLGVESG